VSVKPAPQEVFLSYAPEDEELCLELEKHLGLLKRKGLITIWHKRRLSAGSNWEKEVDRHLSSASVILLLLSANFVDSDYCYGVEMQQAMERHEAGDAYVIPILLRPVDGWQDTRFGRLQPRPGNGKPITLWSNQDAAFADVVKGIRSVLQDGKLPPVSFDFGRLSFSSMGINLPVVDRKIFWRTVPGYVDDSFEMQEHIDFPTLQDRYRIIGLGQGSWKVKVAIAKTFDEIKREWNRLHEHQVGT